MNGIFEKLRMPVIKDGTEWYVWYPMLRDNIRKMNEIIERQQEALKWYAEGNHVGESICQRARDALLPEE